VLNLHRRDEGFGFEKLISQRRSRNGYDEEVEAKKRILKMKSCRRRISWRINHRRRRFGTLWSQNHTWALL